MAKYLRSQHSGLECTNCQGQVYFFIFLCSIYVYINNKILVSFLVDIMLVDALLLPFGIWKSLKEFLLKTFKISITGLYVFTYFLRVDKSLA